MPESKTLTFRGQTERLDRFLSQQFSTISRTYLQKLIKEKHITVEGRTETSRYLLKEGEKIVISFPEFSSLPSSSSKSIPLLFEDKALIVVNKPAGMVVHPAGPHQKETLIQYLWPKLADQWSNIIKQQTRSTARPGVVHRLDRGTSGVILIAKTPQAAFLLSEQFSQRTVKKSYRALIHGIPKTESGKIRSTVGRSRKEPHRMSVESPGRWAETSFKILEKIITKKNHYTLIEVQPLTGRTHQIRVQLASLGFPLVGDSIYGAPKNDEVSRPLLHAYSLEIIHPTSGKKRSWHAPLPQDFKNYLKMLKKQVKSR